MTLCFCSLFSASLHPFISTREIQKQIPALKQNAYNSNIKLHKKKSIRQKHNRFGSALSSVKTLLLLQPQRIGGQSYACVSFSGMWVNFMVHQAHFSVKQRENLQDTVSLFFCASGAALERDAWWNTNYCMFSALWSLTMKYNWWLILVELSIN